MKFVSKGPLNNVSAFFLDNGLAPNRRQGIIWTNAEPIRWHIHVAPGGNELNPH